uniref:C-type lectin domain-containing protein n=1 Tax=Sinocyclocheilus rhinocerous TaxID=307959 RepID=A0A673JX03_9TELE
KWMLPYLSLSLKSTPNPNQTFVHTDGWIYYQSSLYLISSEWKNWAESRRYCTERTSEWKMFWIGLTDSELEGRWKWVDGSTLTPGFCSPGEPNSYTGNEDCALSYISYGYDYSCDSGFKWICEMSILHIVLH